MTRDDAAKDPDELEREVEQQRESMEHTLAELVDRLSPRQLLRQILGEDEGYEPRQLQRLLAANPVPTLLAAAGIGWLIMNRSRSGEAERSRSPSWDEPSHASYGVDPDYDPRSGAGHSALEKEDIEASKSVAYEDNVGSYVNSMLARQPLLVAAFGLVVGGLLGALLPGSAEQQGRSGRLEDFSRRSPGTDEFPEDAESERYTRH